MTKKYLYIDLDTGTFGADSGPTGGGVTFDSGILAPDDGDGADGDWYLRTTNRYLYEKVSGSWTARGQLVPIS